jgi:cyclomaltodextrinase / maltogenic alpha-amylase / neopullulanase
LPTWVEHAIWWQVYPLGFVGAERSAAETSTVDTADGVRHRLGRINNWLDYAIELGASGLALGPVFASGTHGYDTLDHYRIDPRLGDDSDFDALLKAAHERGLRVLLDGVFNHVAPDFPRREWLTGERFEGHPELAVLDHANPEVARYVVDVMSHWLDRGADGWRLDVAHAVPPDFWAAVVPQVRERHPEVYVVGEVIHGDYAAIVRDGHLDAVTQYELWKAIWSSLNDGNLFELAHALERHNGFLDTFVPFTFIGNHDVTRIASRLENDSLLPHALAVLMTVGGTPSIYYGDEQAYRGVKEERAGGDDAVRPEFPDVPGDLGPTYRLHQDLIGMRRRHAWLHRARTEIVHLANTELTYRATAGDNAITVTLDIGDTPQWTIEDQGS